jgi:hypothetical protein
MMLESHDARVVLTTLGGRGKLHLLPPDKYSQFLTSHDSGHAFLCLLCERTCVPDLESDDLRCNTVMKACAIPPGV